MTLPQRIRNLRTEQKLTLEELAKKAKISKPYLWQLENKAGKSPSGEILLRLATALGITVGYLLGAPTVAPSEDSPAEIPPALEQFVREYNRKNTNQISDREKAMLAGINYRGKQPRTKDDWDFLFTVIRRSTKQ